MARPDALTSEAPLPVHARGLQRRYGALRALDNVDLTLSRGEFLTIFGPNGAGKTTLIRILASLSRPTGGAAFIGGLNLATHADGIRRYLGVVSHAPLLYDSLTPEENLRFFARLYRLPSPDGRISELLDQVGLAARRHDLVRTSAGALEVFGLDPRAYPHEVKRRLGLISHNGFLYGGLTARASFPRRPASAHGVASPVVKLQA